MKPKVEEHGDENTKYFDIDGKPLGTGAKGKKLMRGEKDTSAPSVGKAYEVWLEKRQEFLAKKDGVLPESYQDAKGKKGGMARHAAAEAQTRLTQSGSAIHQGEKRDDPTIKPKLIRTDGSTVGEGERIAVKSQKQFGKVQYGVKSLVKEGDGAGNSGVNSSDTTGVYNARYSDSKGRYRDQEKDTDKKGEEKDDGRRSRD